MSREAVAGHPSGDLHRGSDIKACVAQSISRKDWVQIPEAKAAVQKEWDRLLDKKTWRMPEKPEDAEFYDQVIRKSKATGRPIHLGRLFDIGVLKGSELSDGHVDRKYKGRVVFGGITCKTNMAAQRPSLKPGEEPATPVQASCLMP